MLDMRTTLSTSARQRLSAGEALAYPFSQPLTHPPTHSITDSTTTSSLVHLGVYD